MISRWTDFGARWLVLARARTLFVVLVLPLGLLALPADGQRRPASPKMATWILTGWEEDLKRIDALLVEDEGRKAYRLSNRLIDEMVNTIVGGDGAGEMIGVALVLKALAAVQLDRQDEGVWLWLVAQQMFPRVADFKMTAYGTAGPFLKQHAPRGSIEPC